MSTPEFNAVMNKMDLHDRTFKLAKSWGATDELAEVFAASQSAKFKWDGVVLTYNGKNAADDAETKAHFTEGALKPLFPTAATNKDAPKVPPELLESAKAGNLTSRGALVRLLGSLEAAEAALTEKPGNISVVDGKTTTGKTPVGKTESLVRRRVGQRQAARRGAQFGTCEGERNCPKRRQLPWCHVAPIKKHDFNP